MGFLLSVCGQPWFPVYSGLQKPPHPEGVLAPLNFPVKSDHAQPCVSLALISLTLVMPLKCSYMVCILS